ncbi:MAG: hypothetical protein JWQ27_384 [Ferruginibacter sp.]|nr:hypothetical protein [Ferruginibacter sp.]
MNKYSWEVYAELTKSFPDLRNLVSTEGELLIVDKPSGSQGNIGGVVIQTTEDNDLWVRVYAGNSAYCVDDTKELISILEGLFTDQVLWVVAYYNSEWHETTLIQNKAQLKIEADIVYNIYSWSGRLDEVIVKE